jgi:hypothetical protein
MTGTPASASRTRAVSDLGNSARSMGLHNSELELQTTRELFPTHAPDTSDISALAAAAAKVPLREGAVIEILLGAARPPEDGFPALRPLWAQEATHRAVSMLRLSAKLHRANRRCRPIQDVYQERNALHLASELFSLKMTESTDALPCSGSLRETARDLVALFSDTVGRVSINTDVAPLSLPAYRRRALVLLGHELVTNALLHAFHGRSAGQIALRLERLEGGRAILQVCDDGIGFTFGCPDAMINIAGGLADLLQAEIWYFRTKTWNTVAEVIFPV